MTTVDKKTALIESAAALFHRQGYTATGAREIAAVAGLPQGSFTNHFRSKEALASAALDHYFGTLSAMMAATLAVRDRPPAERLLAYFDLIAARLVDAECRRGCLIPDLATEAAVYGDALRSRVAEVMRQQTALFEAVLDQLPTTVAGGDLAAFILAAWHGTLLRMKVERGPEPLDRFRRTLAALLAA